MLPSIIKSKEYTIGQQVSQVEPSSIAIFDNRELGGPTLGELDTFDSRMLISDNSLAEIHGSDSQPQIICAPDIVEAAA